MATRGKHRRALKQSTPSKYGKHAAIVRPQRDPLGVAFSVLLLVALVVIPFSVNRLMVALDSPSVDVGMPFTLPSIAGAAEEVYGVAEEELDRLFATAPVEETVDSLADSASNLPAVGYTSRVGEMRQYSIMEGGCELVSLAIALDSMGLDADIHRIVSDHLVIDGHFATGYSGDPYKRGGGYPAGIAQAANGYLESLGSSCRAEALEGKPFDELLSYVDKGYPVCVWTTMGFADPQFAAAFDNGKEWYDNEHCVVLYGQGENGLLVSDPIDGLVERDQKRFAEIYEACGSMALVIV